MDDQSSSRSAPPKVPWWRRPWVVASGTVFAVVVAVSVTQTPPEEPAGLREPRAQQGDAGAQAAVSDEASKARSFGDGTYVVGADIKPGTYRAPDAGSGCYWARLKNFSGNLGAILANDNASGPAIVTIKRSDRGFESNGCGRWTDDLSAITNSTRRFGPGTYIVGVDLKPGTYRARGNGCYWERLRNFNGALGGIIANDNTNGSTVVTIRSSDRGFSSSRCGVWTRL